MTEVPPSRSWRWSEAFQSGIGKSHLASSPVSRGQPEAWLELTDQHNTMRKPEEHTMKKHLFAALAVLSLLFGTVALAGPANAYTFSLPNQNEGANN